ncbi:ribosomal-protein-alanine N-acetyltransferase [Apostasia shenzhenica]|uniref:Ribosomal-protein-alanine N-acetyltransferase n=1 Tax=Apostasia shenzhenica TaxID=1088818 RepID=A0A2I0BB03_9ASPA|nr:ribosomal-protein-alanine N-acetyltransferase [Apostasia shenzhenica]
MAGPVEVSLRKFEISDLDDFWVWASDERVAATCSWDAYTSKDDLRRYMEETVLPSPWFRAIIVGGRPVGAVSLKQPDESGNRCRGELGYVVAAEWWGKGVATAAVRAATAASMAEVEGMERVEALVVVENVASQRVLEKVGFKREGVLRRYWFNKGRIWDMIIYSFTSLDSFLI